jgi:hypothetical protein
MGEEVNYHQIIDRRSLEMHRLVAGKLRENPSLLVNVKERLRKNMRSNKYSRAVTDALAEWLDILENRPADEILQLLIDPGEEATRLRQSSPFAGVLSDSERKSVLARFR